MKALSLRNRFALAFVLAAWALLAAFALSFYGWTSSALRDALDQELAARLEGLASIVEWDEDEERLEFEPGQALQGSSAGKENSFGFEVRTADGILARGGVGLPSSPEWDDVPGTGPGPSFRTDVGSELRIGRLRVRLPVAGASTSRTEVSLSLHAALSIQPLTARLEDLRSRLWTLSWVSALVVVLLALPLATWWLRPIRELDRAAARKRPAIPMDLPQRGSGDELDRLARTLDRSFRELDDALERQQRFTANAAHELRNPIAGLSSSAEIALRRDRGNEDYRAFFEDCLASARRMQSIVDSLLLLARVESGDDSAALREIDLVSLVDSRLTSAEFTELDVLSDLPGEAPILGHPVLLRTLVDNLLHNAARHGAPDSPIRLEVRASGDDVHFAVENGAEGLTDSDATAFFERFHRGANASGTGSGLGLALVHEIAELHGASAACTVASDRVRVTVRFPSADESAAPPEIPFGP